MDKIKVFAPATVANLGPGFDVLGLALEKLGDILELSTNDSEIISIENEGYELPTDPTENVAGIAAQALIDDYKTKHGKSISGLHIHIKKEVLPGSGLGSSASSAAGAVFGLNILLGEPYSKKELVAFAMEGERASSGKAHADNVAPSLLGGITLVRSYEPLDVAQLHYPEALHVVVIHPQLEVKTADSKRILKKDISLDLAIAQWGNVAGFVAGLAQHDFDLIGRSLQDHIVEPVRSLLIPGFEELKITAMKSGALGCSISGSGPSVFALCKSKSDSQQVAKAMAAAYDQLDIDYHIHQSAINSDGAIVLSE